MKAKSLGILVSLILCVSLLAVVAPPVTSPVKASPSWWDTTWGYRMKLTFNNTVGEALDNFPVLVHLTSGHSGFWSNINSGITTGDTKDLRFVDDDDLTELYFEAEKIDYGAEDALIWVKVPQIDAGTTDFIYVYYGNADASQTDHHSANDVWDSSYTGVWHLNGLSGDVLDSTSNNNNGTNNGATTGVSGQIDSAFDFNAGEDDYVAVTNDPSLEPATITVSLWAKFNDLTRQNQSLIARMDADGYGIFLNPPEPGHLDMIEFIPYIGTYQPAGFSTGDVSTDDTWYYIVGTYDGETVKIYLDGGFKAENTAPSGSINYPSTPDLLFGEDPSGPSPSSPQGLPFDGSLDEIRISDTAHSAGWIEAQYLSMTDQFITYGGQEEAPGGGCFIATAAYGTPMAEEIQILRDFRDQYLLTNPVGEALVEFYYKVSPPAADFIAERDSLRAVVRVGLLPLIGISAFFVKTTLLHKLVTVTLLLLAFSALVMWRRRKRIWLT